MSPTGSAGDEPVEILAADVEETVVLDDDGTVADVVESDVLVARRDDDGDVLEVVETHVVDTEVTGPDGEVPFVPDLVVGDLSFISLTLVLPPLVRVVRPGADLALMVKPQFEVGKGQVGTGGVVRDAALRSQAVRRIAAAAWDLGLGTAGVVASPLPGPSGNVEYFLHLRRGADPLDDADLARAIEEGPQ